MKDYCTQIFGKSLRNLTVTDLENYFSDEKEESEILEFKSGNGDFESTFNKNILRTITSFLNSSGGVMIWGAPEDKPKEKNGPKICIGELIPVTYKKEKDQLINRISTSISYMPNGIRIERLAYKDGFIYIFEIQESDSKPHQLNGQYLIRLDGQTKPAPHYIVDSMFKQIQFADIESESIINSYERNEPYHFIDIGIYFFNFSRNLVGKNVQLHAYIQNGVFTTNNKQDIECMTLTNLHFAVNPVSKLIIQISDAHLVKSNNIIHLQTTIRSDNSLARISQYEINVLKLQNSHPLSDCITRTTNNIPLTEITNNDDIFDDKEKFKNFLLKR